MMGGVTPAQWRDKIGQPIRTRREELRLSVRAAAKKAGFSEGLWRQLESGERVLAKGVVRTVSPKPETAAAAARALGWTADSIDRLLAGEPPEALAPSSSSQSTTEVDQGAVETILSVIVSMSDAHRAVLENIDSRLSGIERHLMTVAPIPRAPRGKQAGD